MAKEILEKANEFVQNLEDDWVVAKFLRVEELEKLAKAAQDPQTRESYWKMFDQEDTELAKELARLTPPRDEPPRKFGKPYDHNPFEIGSEE